MQSIKSQAEESKGNQSLSIAMTRLFDGRRSERERQVQAIRNRKTAIGWSQRKSESDDALSATEETDAELSGETDDEEMEGGR